jgi:photosystem I P700 chlorophyll a apoprotein A2
LHKIQQREEFGMAIAHDLEAHDGMTEENLYQKIFASHFGLSRYLLWTAESIPCRLARKF